MLSVRCGMWLIRKTDIRKDNASGQYVADRSTNLGSAPAHHQWHITESAPELLHQNSNAWPSLRLDWFTGLIVLPRSMLNISKVVFLNFSADEVMHTNREHADNQKVTQVLWHDSGCCTHECKWVWLVRQGDRQLASAIKTPHPTLFCPA